MKNGNKIYAALCAGLALGFLVLGCSQAGPGKPSPRLVRWIKKDYTRELAKVGLKPEQLEVYSLGQSHIDAAWRWRYRQTRDEKCPKTFENALKSARLFPSFSFHQSSPQYYQWIKDTKPELFRAIVEAEKKGNWVLVGGMWVEPDANMPEGESLVRQQLYGQRFYLENFGHISATAWLPDSFGYNWNLPQIFARSGQKYMWTQKPARNEYNLFPFHLFHWQGPDGSRILTNICPTPGKNNYFKFSEFRSAGGDNYVLAQLGAMERKFGRNLRQTRYLLKPGEKLIANYRTAPQKIRAGLSEDLIPVMGTYYGVGDGGHGPKKFEIERQLALQELGFAKMATAPELFTAFEKYSDRLPVWNDELYLDFHQGVFTTHEWIKRANRNAEARLRAAEAVSSLAFLFGDQYPLAQLTGIWKLVLLNQFHDILPGSSIREVYEDAASDYEQVQAGSSELIAAGLKSLSAKINIPPAGAGLDPIMVFNPLGWARADVVRYAVKGSGKFQVFDQAGKELRSQAAASEQGESDLYFSPDSIPALGWNTFYVKAGAACALPGPAVTESADKIVIENDLIKVAIDKKTGLLISLFDKRLGKEMLKAPSNKVVAYTDRPTEYPAWNLAENYLAKPIPVPAATSVKVDAQGPVFVRVLVERKGRPTSFKQWITVYSDSPLVNLITWSDMHWKNSITKIEFNTAVETDKVAAEIPYAVISRSTHPKVPWDKARTEMPVEKWADLSEKDFGVALLNFGKYAFSLTEDGQGFRMSIVKNAKYPTAASEAYDVSLMEKIIPYQETDAGEHWAHLALLPHPGDWKTAKVYKSAYEYNTPAVVYPTNAHDGLLPKEASLLSLESASAYIAQVKKAEDDGDLVVRMVEAEGKDGSATLKVNPAFKIMSAVETNLLELEPKPLKFDGQSVTVPLGHFEIKTLKIGLASK